MKSLSLNATKVANYDKLRAEFEGAVGERDRLEGQLQQAIQDRDYYLSQWNLSKSQRASLDDRITDLLSKVTGLEVEVANLRGQLDIERQRADDAQKGFYESEEYATLEETILNSGREEVFYTVWMKYPDLDFSFLGPEVVSVIEGFKAKLAEEAAPITEVPDEEAQQPGEEEAQGMDDDLGTDQ